MKVSVQLNATSVLSPGEETPPPQYRLYRTLCGLHSRSRRIIEQNIFFYLPGIEVRFLGHQTLAYSLFRRRCPGSQSSVQKSCYSGDNEAGAQSEPLNLTSCRV